MQIDDFAVFFRIFIKKLIKLLQISQTCGKIELVLIMIILRRCNKWLNVTSAVRA